MAIRRMLSKKIIDTDAFMDMPLSSQALYMHLVLNADDDGFVGNPRKVMRSVGCMNDDINILLGKRFLLDFDSGVIVIKHWKIHNLIRHDRYTETTYLLEKSSLVESDNKAYTELNKGVILDVIPNGNHMAPQVSIGKVSLVKSSKGNNKRFVIPTIEQVEEYCKERKNNVNANAFIDFYESKGWLIGKNKMKSWKAAVRTWENNSKGNGVINKGKLPNDIESDWLDDYIAGTKES